MTGFWMHVDAIMEGFWIFHDSKYGRLQRDWYACMWVKHAWINCSDHFEYGILLKYAWSTFHRVLNLLPVLNIPGFRVWLGCEYLRVTRGAEFAWTILNVPYQCFSMCEHALIMLNTLEYAWIHLNKKSS